jgi:hypothetical protein
MRNQDELVFIPTASIQPSMSCNGNVDIGSRHILAEQNIAPLVPENDVSIAENPTNDVGSKSCCWE